MTPATFDRHLSRFEKKRSKMPPPTALGQRSVARRFAWPNPLVGFLSNISDTTRASYFKIYRNVARDSSYIRTGNYVVTSDRQLIAQTCQFLVILGPTFLDNGSIDFEKVYTFFNGDSSASFVSYNLLDMFAP